MGILKKSMIAIAASWALAGCAGMELQRVEKAEASSSTFEANLYNGYVKLAKAEFDEGDYRDSDHFARTAAATQGDTPPAPQAIGARKLPEARVVELTGARQRLIEAQASQAGSDLPDQAANAQVMFDCWMQEQEENFQAADIAACKDSYYASMAALEERNLALAEAEKARLAAAKPAPVMPATAKKMAPMHFFVYFDTDKFELNDAAVAVLAEVEAAAKNHNALKVDVLGNTDTVGKESYNIGLSDRRAEAVAKKLILQGITDASIKTTGLGMTNLAVETPPNVDEPKNRRVEIVVQP